MTELLGDPATVRRTSILDHLDRRTPGHSLPGVLYTDPEVFASEIELLWRRRWLFVGTVAEVPEPGDYLTFDVAGSSVLVIRDDDEQVRAFHNVCRHRGSRLVTAGQGSVGNLVCGYHSWTYATDGSLRYAPQLSPSIDTTCLGLRPVALREVGGLLYCSLADSPDDDLDAVAAQVRDYLTPHRLDRAKVAAQVDLVEEGNWKLVMENNRECYHCEGGHPELTCTFFPTWGLREDQVPERLRGDHDRYLLAEADLARRCDELGIPHRLLEDLVGRPLGFRIQREPLDGAGESFSPDGSRLVGRLLGDLADPRLGRCTFHTQPNAWIHLLADHVVTFSVTPISPDRTLVRSTWLVSADAVEGVDYDVESLTAVWRATNAQDAVFVRNTQLGVADPAYVPGPYNEAERQVDDFVRWYEAQIRSEARIPSPRGGSDG
ncbi:Rieske 2Fe-2S family protein [Nocardioides luteus]|uniref:(Fe-S)-binding protein n=1 Tax=Nocardioides luteus TaxID=1844 RepID=A0ABQ5SUK6_9ACTN|nr:aromatic ring-hydroxylating dioxygenase subunit alpha [Nocardioides luteus]MDR7309467.1 Rieske 2Fe-2S family protein [Nocardioides luteus]GGR51413.1 (Fe-S)-binding protein [Nocardioides luteus]GLJ67873.1 (Fe-S)-binding protein [Nocardioides luteus]